MKLEKLCPAGRGHGEKEAENRLGWRMVFHIVVRFYSSGADHLLLRQGKL